MTEEKQHSGDSYWLTTAPGGERHPALADDLDVDVAVIGGGIAGLCTAWELARAGRAVAVLEAGRIAADVTGHTTAKVTALHSLVYDKLRRTRGSEGARLYARSQAEAIGPGAGRGGGGAGRRLRVGAAQLVHVRHGRGPGGRGARGGAGRAGGGPARVVRGGWGCRFRWRGRWR
ncbi:tRNA 5-methylaminomethyl-2-thiouridine biosynthesis bifunctional protein MnmC [Streptomyces tendae]